MTPVFKQMGYGMYIEGQVEGALPNGSRIRKAVFEEGDFHHVGATGTIISSVNDPEVDPRLFYFVVWDDIPSTPVGVLAHKIERIEV